ncbi:MAG: DUF2333 family protein [Actinomycetota bacterium]
MTDQSSIPDPALAAPPADQTPWERWRTPFPLWWVAVAAVVGLLLAYPTGMLLQHKIDDDADFAPAAVAQGQSRAVAIAAALVNREVEINGWTANDPFPTPGWALDNMPNFQMGIVAAAARFAGALADETGQVNGPAAVDNELSRAAGLLRYPGTVWKFDPRTAWARTASAEKQYRLAVRSLESYNEHVAAGTATFDRRAAVAAGVLAAVAHDLESLAEAADRHMADHHWALFDLKADDVFYGAKGRLYAYGLMLRELGRDISPLLGSRQLAGQWNDMVEAFRAAGQLEPLVVLNGSPDATLMPSHVASQGFLGERARMRVLQMAEALRRG